MKSSALLLFLVGLAALAGTMGARPDPLTRAAPHGIGEAATLTRESARTGVAHPTSDSSKSKPVNRGRALLSEDWQLYMLDLVNGARASAGLYPLCLNAALNAAAQAHAEDQAAMQTMSHAGSDGSDESVRVEAAGYYDWTSLGENVAYGYDTVEDVFQGWMESPGHYANIMSADFAHMGIGYADTYWSQNFGASSSQGCS